MPKLEQHHLDLIGLGLVAAAAFFAFVLYMGETGGQAGDGAKDGLRYLLGGAAYLVPPALLSAGVILVLRPLLPTVKPFRAGAICLLLGLTLGLAAGSLGLGPGQAEHSPLLDTSYVSDRGGALGELEFWAARTLFSTVGAHIIFVFLMAGGILLVTGASVAGVVSATRERMARTGERVRRSTAEIAAALNRDTGATARLEPTDARRPPEPPGEEPVVHATHVEAPALDAAERYPDLFGAGEPEDEAPEPGSRDRRVGGRRAARRGPDRGGAGRDGGGRGPRAARRRVAHAARQSPHGRDRGRGGRVHAAPPRTRSSARTASSRSRAAPTSGSAPSWWRPSATSASRPPWWAASAART